MQLTTCFIVVFVLLEIISHLQRQIRKKYTDDFSCKSIIASSMHGQFSFSKICHDQNKDLTQSWIYTLVGKSCEGNLYIGERGDQNEKLDSDQWNKNVGTNEP